MATSEKRREHHKESKSCSVDQENSRYECNICYKEAVNPVVLQCGHFYCWECIDKWLSMYTHSKKQCPICKKHVRDDGVIPIYGKGIMGYCEKPRPSAPASSQDDDESQSSTDDTDWLDFFRIVAVVAGLFGAFMLGRLAGRRTRRN